jgi:ankyrin repeat protein
MLLCRLIDSGAAADVFAACVLGDQASVRSMLSATSVDACGVHDLPLLHFGVMSRDISMLEMLIDFGVSLNPPSASLPPLHSAVAVGSAPMVRVLLSAGARPQSTDAFGATALDWAHEFEGGESELVALLTCSNGS